MVHARVGQDRRGQDGTGSDKQDRIRHYSTGKDGTGQDGTRYVRTGQGGTGQDGTLTGWDKIRQNSRMGQDKV